VQRLYAGPQYRDQAETRVAGRSSLKQVLKGIMKHYGKLQPSVRGEVRPVTVSHSDPLAAKRRVPAIRVYPSPPD
jgi:hypothetical protein